MKDAYYKFIESLSIYKNKAIENAYIAGYITDEEATKLKEDGVVQRNECTSIQVFDSFDKVELVCLEHTVIDKVCYFERIFKLLYMKDNGTLIDERNLDIVN